MLPKIFQTDENLKKERKQFVKFSFFLFSEFFFFVEIFHKVTCLDTLACMYILHLTFIQE